MSGHVPRITTLFQSATLAAVITLGSTQGLAKGDWPQWGRNPQFWSTNPSPVVAGDRKGWEFKAAERVVGSPAVANGRLHVGSDDGTFYCLNASTGALEWKYSIPFYSNCTGFRAEHAECKCNKIRSCPAVDDQGSVYFGAYDFNIYKLDKDGKLVWTVPTASAIYGPVTIDTDGTVFVGSFDGFLRSITRDGKVNWKFQLGAHGDAGPVIGAGEYSGYLIIQSNEGGNCTHFPPETPGKSGGICNIYCLNKTTGELLWSKPTGLPGGGGAVAGYTYFQGNWNSWINAWDIRTGEELWWYKTFSTIESHPAYDVDTNTLYVSAEEDKTLFALDATTGKLKWTYTGAAQELNSSPSVSKDLVYVGSNDMYLHAVDKITGEFKFKFKTCANVFSSAAIDDQGWIYTTCNTGTGPGAPGIGAMYAFNPLLQIQAGVELSLNSTM